MLENFDKLLQDRYNAIEKLKRDNGPDIDNWTSQNRQKLRSEVEQINYINAAKDVPKNYANFLLASGVSDGKPFTVALVRILSFIAGVPRGREVLRYDYLAQIFMDLNWEIFKQNISWQFNI